MANLNMTLAEYRQQCGSNKFVAIVPDSSTHVQTRPVEIVHRLPPSPGWPEGRVERTIGPEILEVHETSDGYRVVCFRSPATFKSLCQGGNGLAWTTANAELRMQIANETKRSAGPI